MSYLLHIPEDDAIAELKKLHGVGEVEAHHLLQVMRGNVGDPHPPPEDLEEEPSVRPR